MVVHEDEGEAGEGEQAGGYGDQTMLVQRVSHLYMQWCLKCIEFTEKSTQFVSQNIVKQEDKSLWSTSTVLYFFTYTVYTNGQIKKTLCNVESLYMHK